MARKKIKVPSLNEMKKKFSGFSIAAEEDDSKLPWLPSRFLAFNHVLGGGIPYGKILELFCLLLSIFEWSSFVDRCRTIVY